MSTILRAAASAGADLAPVVESDVQFDLA